MNYGWQGTQAPYSCGYLVPVVLKILDRLQPTRVLDIGCGNGVLCSAMARAGYRVTGIENDDAGVELARTSFPHIRFYHFGVQDDPARLLAAERELFDVVVATEVIEHLYAPHELPQYARAVLSDAGILILTTPYHGYLKNLALSVLNKWDSHHGPLWHGGHIKFWSRKTLSRLLRDAGFEVVGFRGIGRCPFFWKSMALIARKTHGVA
ncbi:MAG: class I SAM-dependent methyltransferase [Nevskiales bacterium]|nr:class I SAM-dependent methyltransferase [Nevskiales bacterium]